MIFVMRCCKLTKQLVTNGRSVHGVTWTDREGMKADRSQYFTGQNPGPDARRTMIMAGLHVITDARVNQYPEAGDGRFKQIVRVAVKFE